MVYITCPDRIRTYSLFLTRVPGGGYNVVGLNHWSAAATVSDPAYLEIDPLAWTPNRKLLPGDDFSVSSTRTGRPRYDGSDGMRARRGRVRLTRVSIGIDNPSRTGH